MILGLDLSRRDVACVLAKPNGDSVFALRAPLPANADSLGQWRALIDVAQETLIRSMQPRETISNVVLAIEARVDANGKIEKSPGSEGWHNFDLIAGLRENLRIENTQVFNRTICEGAGEKCFGALKSINANSSDDLVIASPNATTAKLDEATSSTRSASTRSALFVHLGASLGAAFFDGDSWRLVDIGEIVIERDGSIGSGGRRGTLEASCSEENFLARAASYGITLRAEKEIWEMAQGNFAAQSLRDDFVRRLCHGLGIAWTLLQPDNIILGGSLAVALGDELLQSVRRGIHEFCALKDENAIINGALGHDAAVLGAVGLAKSAEILVLRNAAPATYRVLDMHVAPATQHSNLSTLHLSNYETHSWRGR